MRGHRVIAAVVAVVDAVARVDVQGGGCGYVLAVKALSGGKVVASLQASLSYSFAAAGVAVIGFGIGNSV